MKLLICGGCGDQGRNSFYVEGVRHAFFVDAGTSTDGRDRLPHFTQEEIRKAEFVFLTHSHKDHTGAVEFLEENGFKGQVIMSNQTYKQLRYKPRYTMIIDSTAPELDLESDFSVRWGRTGHCAGSVWYMLSVEGKNLFFSGDYREGDPFYRSDPARGMSADIAVIDGAYSREDQGEEMREAVIGRAAELLQKGPLLLPVPRYGRGLSLAVLLRERLGEDFPIYLDLRLHDQWMMLGKRKYFATDRALQISPESFRQWDGKKFCGKGVYFLTDAQLSRYESRGLVESEPALSVLLTGSIHGYGNAGEFLERGQAEMVLWPNHQTMKECRDLAEANHFERVIPYHNRCLPAESDQIFF